MDLATLKSMRPIAEDAIPTFCREAVASSHASQDVKAMMSDYLEREIIEFTKQSAWDSVVHGFNTDVKTSNPSNLIIPFILGMTDIDPFQHYAILGKKPGKKSCIEFTCKQSDGTQVEIVVSTDQMIILSDWTAKKAYEISAGLQFAGGLDILNVRQILASHVKVKCQDPSSPYVHQGAFLIPSTLTHEWYVSSDVPDVDIDFSPWVRDHIKEWASETFGRDKVASICNYNYFRVKSALKDCSRVCGVPYVDTNNLTKVLHDDINDMTWEEACEVYPEIVAFEEKYPKASMIARKLVGRRRNLGTHASGLTIASVPIDKFVPLVAKNGQPMSSFSEGLRFSDLKTFGLVKFDILGLSTLEDIDKALSLIKSRYVKLTTDMGTFALPKTKQVRIIRAGAESIIMVQDLQPGDEVLGTV